MTARSLFNTEFLWERFSVLAKLAENAKFFLKKEPIPHFLLCLVFLAVFACFARFSILKKALLLEVRYLVPGALGMFLSLTSPRISCVSAYLKVCVCAGTA